MKTIDNIIENTKIRNKIGIKLKNAYDKRQPLIYNHFAYKYASKGTNVFLEYNYLIDLYNNR